MSARPITAATAPHRCFAERRNPRRVTVRLVVGEAPAFALVVRGPRWVRLLHGCYPLQLERRAVGTLHTEPVTPVVSDRFLAALAARVEVWGASAGARRLLRAARRGCLAAVLAALFLAPGPASAGGRWTPPATLAEVDRALAGRKARIELADGSTVEGAKKVEVGPETTFFQMGDEGRQVPTTTITRITALRDRRTVLGFATGALIGGVVAGLSAENERDDGLFDAVVVPFAVGLGAGVGAGAGAALGATVGKRPERIVYEAPLALYLEAYERELASAAAEGRKQPVP